MSLAIASVFSCCTSAIGFGVVIILRQRRLAFSIRPREVVGKPEIDPGLEQEERQSRQPARLERRGNHREEEHKAHMQSRGASRRPAQRDPAPRSSTSSAIAGTSVAHQQHRDLQSSVASRRARPRANRSDRVAPGLQQ